MLSAAKHLLLVLHETLQAASLRMFVLATMCTVET